MKTLALFALTTIGAVPLLTGQHSTDSSKLESLQGTLITEIRKGVGLPAKVWAKGNNTRLEMAADKQKVITLQLGDTMYTYTEGSRTGKKERIKAGLGAMGLIKQIEDVKAKGKKDSSQEIEGVLYDKYVYGEIGRGEMAVVFLSAKTSLPRIWLSTVMIDEKTASLLTTYYRDMKANVDISDDMFKIPRDVRFSEQ